MKNIQIPKAPVLLIGFNRPDTMQLVFNAVRTAKPDKLYYAVDGARPGKDEEDRVQQVRDIVKQVDWPCEVHRLFREKNVGCGFGPAGAISWAFENEDYLIVLEDDCLPSQSFFRFCNEMLQRYKDDERVNIVSGRSHQHGSKFFNKYDYVFTHYAHTWGWATWKRVWNQFDIYMKDFPEWIENGGSMNVLEKEMAVGTDKSLSLIYNDIEKEVTHSWDSQWYYTRLKTGGLGIVPCRNLIHNIGAGGTHTLSYDKLPLEEMPLTIRHPSFVVINGDYEQYHYENHIHKRNVNPIRSVLSKFLKYLKK